MIVANPLIIRRAPRMYTFEEILVINYALKINDFNTVSRICTAAITRSLGIPKRIFLGESSYK